MKSLISSIHTEITKISRIDMKITRKPKSLKSALHLRRKQSSISTHTTDVLSEPSQLSKMEIFVKMVNDWLTILAKSLCKKRWNVNISLRDPTWGFFILWKSNSSFFEKCSFFILNHSIKFKSCYVIIRFSCLWLVI